MRFLKGATGVGLFRIYDRINDSDIDITDQSNAVYQLYARKNGSYFVNKVTGFGVDSLRPDGTGTRGGK